jgi:hypothetical protein
MEASWVQTGGEPRSEWGQMNHTKWHQSKRVIGCFCSVIAASRRNNLSINGHIDVGCGFVAEWLLFRA